tara:strand:+ start:41 stop:745 length:705 start_codon:yes stop_codon:yes gene_type:complete
MAETKNKGALASEKLVNDLTSWFKNLSKKRNKKKKFDFNYDAQRARIKRLAESKNMADLSAPEIKKAVKEKLTKDYSATDKGISGIKDDIKRFNAKRLTNRQSDASRTARPKQFKDIGDKISTIKKEKPKAGSEIGPSAGSKRKERMNGKDTVSSNQKSRQATLPKDSREDGIGVKIARMLGDKRSVDKMISDREESERMEEEMGLRKGGAVSKKYGMREGGFTKRGGMYKKGY